MRISPLVMLLLVGCTDPAVVQTELHVTATMTPAQIRAGERALVTITVTNLGRRYHEVSPYSCPAAFEVTSMNGTPVGPARSLCTLEGLSPKRLAPGEAWSRSWVWRGESSGGSFWPSPSARLLAAGQYQIRPRVFAFFGRRADLVAAAPLDVRIE